MESTIDSRTIGVVERVNFVNSAALRSKVHGLIPGGTHTYAKGDDQFPELAPGFIARGQGSRVWDVDGNEYIEYGQGNRCVSLGHAYEPVVQAAYKAMLDGANFTRPSPLEVECAEQFLAMVPGHDMVKFAKNGSDATTAALKLARAATGREKIAICGDHPFFSIDDWFIGATPLDAGIPPGVKVLTVAFRYNDIASLEAVFTQHSCEVAAVILEPAKYDEPQDNFLHKVQALCRRHGTVLILDEMITGFRWDNGGAQKLYGVTPDLTTFGKAMANGFSLSALAGRRDLMERGGLDHPHERVFLLSTTHGAETHALAAGLEVMRIYEREPVIETLDRQGRRLAEGLRQAIARHGLCDYVEIIGRPCCLVHVARDEGRQPSQAFRTLLLQETIRRGVIAPSLVVSYTHTDDDIALTIEAWDGAMAVYGQALEDGVENYLVGRPSQSVYRKFN
ncbi:MAG: glutamate-1-semialdehyde 2,1-aminomutase [Planctomycetes bacterium]|nr:glutamate-1-semialdehyde 2,1-aminomutase [Planctomycetota bacterium]